MVRGSSERSPTTFRGFLSQLKQRGSGLLITGETPAWVRQHASRQLFGAVRLQGAEPPRRRIVVRTSKGTDPAKYLPTGTQVSDDLVRVVSHSRPIRSTATVTSPEAGVNGPSITDGPDRLAESVVETIESLATVDGGVEPGELRLGATSLRPLVESYGEDGVLEFCETVANAVRSYCGMAHFQYPAADADRLIDLLTGQLDARIELRQQDCDPVQCRWHTPYPKLNSELGWVDFG